MDYSSTQEFRSVHMPDVVIVVNKMSFGRRVELMRRVRELGRKLEFHEAGTGVPDQVDAAILSAELARAYFEWGVRSVEGLVVDGKAGGLDVVAEGGPEELFMECVALVKATCQLT